MGCPKVVVADLDTSAFLSHQTVKVSEVKELNLFLEKDDNLYLKLQTNKYNWVSHLTHYGFDSAWGFITCATELQSFSMLAEIASCRVCISQTGL